MSAENIPAWSLGDRLAKARETAGVSRGEMADYLGVSTNTISNYENDHTTPPGGTVRAWALKCGVPFEWLAKGGSLETPRILDLFETVNRAPLGVIGQQQFTFPTRAPLFSPSQRASA